MKTLKEKPFFSIVIPCYNSGKTIGRLLNSIVAQNMSDEIEVILSDDHSTESYESAIKPFYDKLCIKRIVTDYNCCPGNTREKGTTLVEGEWLLFVDHDDIFLPNTFKKVKKEIINNNETLLAYCNIYRAQNTTGNFDMKLVERKMCSYTGLLHGKFFNYENLWKHYDIHFKKDMFTHEDTYITTVIKCILQHLDHKPLHIDEFNYVWFDNKKSLSNSGENGMRNFLEKYFHYYVEGTSYVYKDFYNKGWIDDNYTVYYCIRTILYEYFYLQMFLFHNPENYIKENVLVCKNDLVETKRMFKLTNLDIFGYCSQNNAKIFSDISIEVGFGYIPNYSLMEWLNTLDKD